MESDQTNGQFRSQFAKKIAESDDFVEKERLPLRRGLSESVLLDIDVDVGINESLLGTKQSVNNFGSVVSLPYLSGEGEWLSPQKFRDILDKKERNLTMRCSSLAENAIVDSTTSSSQITKTMLSTTPTKLDNERVQSDLARLEKENWKLRRQLNMVGMQPKEEMGCLGHQDSKYEELMKEVARLQTIVNKMENSKTMYETSTKQLATFLETFASQLAVSNPEDMDSQETGSFDSLLSRPSFESDCYRPDSGSYRPARDSYRPDGGSYRPDSDSYRPESGSYRSESGSYRSNGDSYRPDSGSYQPYSDSYRLGFSSYKNIPSRPSIDSCVTAPSRPSVDSYKTMPSRPASYNTIYSSHGTLPNSVSNIIPTRSDSYSRLPDSNTRLPHSYSRLPPDSYRRQPLRPEGSNRLPARSDSFNSVLSSRSQSGSRDDERMGRKKGTVGPARSRILMGSTTVRRALARDTGSLARKASSSLDLLEDRPGDGHLPGSLAEDARRQDHSSGEKRSLKVRSKSVASGLSNSIHTNTQKVAGENKDTTKSPVDKKAKTKVQMFLLQIRNLVAKDKSKSCLKKNNQLVMEDNHAVGESPSCRTVIRIGNSSSMSRSKSQKLQQTKVTPHNKLKPAHQSTPKLLK